jgi:hypothetical protein
MDGIPIAEHFPSSESQAVTETTNLAQLLTASKFTDQVQAWADKTGAGTSDYVTGLAKDNPFPKTPRVSENVSTYAQLSILKAKVRLARGANRHNQLRHNSKVH